MHIAYYPISIHSSLIALRVYVCVLCIGFSYSYSSICHLPHREYCSIYYTLDKWIRSRSRYMCMWIRGMESSVEWLMKQCGNVRLHRSDLSFIRSTQTHHHRFHRIAVPDANKIHKIGETILSPKQTHTPPSIKGRRSRRSTNRKIVYEFTTNSINTSSSG